MRIDVGQASDHRRRRRGNWNRRRGRAWLLLRPGADRRLRRSCGRLWWCSRWRRRLRLRWRGRGRLAIARNEHHRAQKKSGHQNEATEKLSGQAILPGIGSGNSVLRAKQMHCSAKIQKMRAEVEVTCLGHDSLRQGWSERQAMRLSTKSEDQRAINDLFT